MIDAYVAGDDLTALAAALDLAEVGLRVRVERRGDALPMGPQLDHDGSLAVLMERLAEPVAEGGSVDAGSRPQPIPPRPLLLRSAAGSWLPAPDPSVQGVPVVPLVRECLALLGTGRALRAYLDRVKPLLTIGKTQEYGPLVRSRIGAAAQRILVEPVVRERFGRGADEVDTAIVAPGLNEALSRAGSLTNGALAYLDRNVARETRVQPRDGWAALHEALLERLALYGVEFAETPSSGIRGEGDRWIVTTGSGPGSDSGSGSASAAGSESSQGELQSDGGGPDGGGAAGIAAGTAGTLEASAVIAGFGTRFGEQPGFDEASLVELALVPARLHVRLDASAAGSDPSQNWPTPDRLAERDALGLSTVAGEVWSVRAVAASQEARGFECAGPVAAEPQSPAETDRIVGRLADELGIPAGAAGQTGAPASRLVREWRAAPFASRAERDAARSRIAAVREERAALVPVGARLHGDDLSAALRSAHEETVILRRRLLGLAD